MLSPVICGQIPLLQACCEYQRHCRQCTRCLTEAEVNGGWNYYYHDPTVADPASLHWSVLGGQNHKLSSEEEGALEMTWFNLLNWANLVPKRALVGAWAVVLLDVSPLQPPKHV